MESELLKKLPICCWEIIFERLDQASDRESISLVCKDFWQIMNSIQDMLAVFSPCITVLTEQLQRFRHVKKIHLVNFLGDLNKAILLISQSGLNLEELDLSCNGNLPDVCLQKLGSGMKNLKILICSRSSLKDFDLVRIANVFPQLEEINISDSCFPQIIDGKIIAVTDEGIEFLSSKLKRLQRIDLSGNQCISDKSLISLSLNCTFLQQIVVGYAKDITENGISFLLHYSPHLTSLVLRAHFKIQSLSVESFPGHLHLQSLKFSSLNISDEFLNSVAKASIPLKELNLIFCKNYTFSGILLLLQSHRTLKFLALLGAEFLTNEHIEYLTPFLQNLSSIQLHGCPLLSDSAFAILSERCHLLLTRLEMGDSSLGRDHLNNYCPRKNFTITCLNLSYNRYLTSSSLKTVLSACPNLERLNLSACFEGTEQLDIADILKYNSKINSLELNRCLGLKFSAEKARISKLERIVSIYSGMNDEILTKIGMNCPGLLHLNLEYCEDVTEKGVKEIVKSCQRLRYLKLSACSNVDVAVVEYIVQNLPSLRRLVSSPHQYPEEDDQKYLLQQGCLVTKGVDYEALI